MKKDLERLMKEHDVDAILITGTSDHNPFMYYYTGFHHLSDADILKIKNKEPVLYYNPMERDEAAATGLKIIGYSKFDHMTLRKQAKGDAIAYRTALYTRIFTDAGLTKGRVMFYGKADVGNHHEIAKQVEKTMPGIHFIGDGSQQVLMGARQTKDEEELERIRKMGAITTRVVGRTADFITSHQAKRGLLVQKDGSPLTIGDVKNKINMWLAEEGAENPEGTIFAIGRDAGIGHTSGTDTDPLSLGKTIVFDIFPCEQGGGYCYDFTRTWCLGYAPDEVQKLYGDVKSVYDQMVSELKNNTVANIYQSRTCELFEKQGHPTVGSNPETLNGYIHSLGHGVGINVQEKPFFSVTVEDMLATGSVFTIEPGLYYPEQGMGIRIEDCYCITPQGKIEIMAHYPYDLVLKVKGA